MVKIKKIELYLSNEDKIDIKLKFNNQKKLVNFVLNYRGKLKGTWYQIYRVDTCHNYLHEQKFWITHKPKRIPHDGNVNLKSIVDKYLDTIKENHKKYRSYYHNKRINKNGK